MDNENRTPQNTNIDTEYIPHSGSDHLSDEVREQPQREFDKTPLNVAVDSGLVEPKLPQGVTVGDLLSRTTQEASPISTSEKDPWYKSTAVKIGAAVTGVAAAGALIVGLALPKGDSDHSDNIPQNNPVATSEPAATETANPVESSAPTAAPETGELTVQNLEIPAGLSAETYGAEFIEKSLSTWAMAGATQENEMEWVKSGDNSSEYLSDLAQKNADIFATALFTPDWKNVPEIVQFVNSATERNKDSLELYFKTDLLGETAYTYSASANTTSEENNDSGRVLITTGTEYNNSSENKAGELEPNLLNLDNNAFTFTMSTIVVDGIEKVSGLTSK